jgi:hypothetical protein
MPVINNSNILDEYFDNDISIEFHLTLHIPQNIPIPTLMSDANESSTAKAHHLE